jgi:hypothetical protein
MEERYPKSIAPANRAKLQREEAKLRILREMNAQTSES